MVQDVKHAPIALNLLSGISEHLQASLQEIFEHSQRLQRQAKEEDRAPVCLSDVEAISSGCANVLSAVNQLMDLVQLERETAEFLEQDVRVQDVLERAYLGSCEVARRQGAALRMCNLAPDAVVSADPRRVQQILISLVNAALSHTRDDALIELTAKANEDGGLEISVATGEPPVRPQMRSTAVDSGSVEAARLELELSIAERIARRMNCELSFESKPQNEAVHILTFTSDRIVCRDLRRNVG